jgi:drug/metabolite transporter (DMT)-like permease
MALFSFLGAALLPVPFILWTTDTISKYSQALILASFIGAVSLAVGFYLVNKFLQDSTPAGTNAQPGD